MYNAPMPIPVSVELNPQFQKALDAIASGKNLFITGKAGTGKSTLLQYFRKNAPGKIVVLAPTGVAALNVQGETIHSFFGFKPDITADKIKKKKGKKGLLYREVDRIVIDEISMVRADLLDHVDRFLRLNGRHIDLPFGGVQMVLIGDLYQLPPVVTPREKALFGSLYESPYFFDSRVFRDHPMDMIELEKIYRQKDARFIEVLNTIRNNTPRPEHLAVLNARVGAPLDQGGRGGPTVHLTPTNAQAAAINDDHLNRLKGPVRTFSAKVSTDFEGHASPAEADLRLAEGAQVMLLNNDPVGRWVNGTLAQVVGFSRDESAEEDLVAVALADGSVEEVRPFTWDLFHFVYNATTKAIETESRGSFKQLPLKLAWAVTIHKSQGKTFDRVILDMGRGAFAHGQTYVALSRCTTLEGLSLVQPIQKSHIWMDLKIVRFMTRLKAGALGSERTMEELMREIKRAIAEKSPLDILYLNSSDEKFRRTVVPRRVGPMEFYGSTFDGLAAYCLHRREDRVFRLDRILELTPAPAGARSFPTELPL